MLSSLYSIHFGMTRACCPYIVCLLILCSSVRGQAIVFEQPHPITYPELSNPLIPLVSESSNKDYFIKHVYNEQVNYGGLLPKAWLTISPELLSFYGEATLFHLDVQKKGALIGIDTSLQITYYTNSNAQDGRFKGIFSTKPYGHRIKKLSLPGFDAGDIHSFYISPTWDVLIFSTQRKKGAGREDLYVSLLKDGRWAAPVSLGVSINTAGAEISPFLSRDTKKLFFSSDGHGGYGRGDLFVAERLYDSWQVWSAPVNLGKEINSTGYEAYLSIMEDSVAYFLSETDGQGKLWTASVTSPPQYDQRREAADGRTYLSEKEVEDWLGATVNTTLSFILNDVALTRDSQELLWFVANQMVRDSQIYINISFLPQSADHRAREKFIIVRNYLTLLGIDEQRIVSQVLIDRKEHPAEADATFSFFRKQ